MPGYITYFDEIKDNAQQSQLRYIVGGLAVPLELIGDVEAALNELAFRTFGTADLTKMTEFHASHIYFGKGTFKGWDPLKRIQLLVSIGEIFSNSQDIKRVYASIDTSKLWSDNAPEVAFAHFCERVQMLARGVGPTILIGDLDDQQATKMIKAFSTFRASGTPWAYGIAITHIVDAVHFARSHHSRMIQLADTYLFLLSHRHWPTRKGWMAEKLSEAMRNIETYGHRYKEWPN